MTKKLTTHASISSSTLITKLKVLWSWSRNFKSKQKPWHSSLNFTFRCYLLFFLTLTISYYFGLQAEFVLLFHAFANVTLSKMNGSFPSSFFKICISIKFSLQQPICTNSVLNLHNMFDLVSIVHRIFLHHRWPVLVAHSLLPGLRQRQGELWVQSYIVRPYLKTANE